MPLANTNVTDKKYKKLSIQVALNCFSFCCTNTLSNTIFYYNEFIFNNLETNNKIDDFLSDIFLKFPELNEAYDEIVVLHYNNLVTFVPVALFDEKHVGNYLQYNTKVFETDAFAFDCLNNYQMNAVYIPYTHINNFFIDKFGAFDYKHATSILVSKILDYSNIDNQKKMVVHFEKNQFEIIVVQNKKLLFYNSFQYKTPEDFIYYILFTSEQLSMNPNTFCLELIGKINLESEYYKIAYQYIRNIYFFNTTNRLQKNNSFSKTENNAHFILFNS